jgi:PAS domain S-box-containing protein
MDPSTDRDPAEAGRDRRRWALAVVSLISIAALATAEHGGVVWIVAMIASVLGLAGLSTLIVERARDRGVRRDLLTAERRYRQLVEEGPGLIYEWEFGTPGRWRYVSPQIERLLGYAAHEFLEDPDLWFRLIHDDDREAVLAAEELSQEVAAGERLEYRMHHREGRVVWVRDEALAVTDEGDRSFFRGILVEITWQKLAEQEIADLNRDLERRVDERTAELHRANIELREAKEQAVRANRVQAEFLSRASHELRTPLNAILGFGQLLLASPLQESDEEAVRHIVAGGKRLLELVNDVLDISAVRAGQLSLSIEPVFLADVVEEVLQAVRPDADHRSIALDPPDGVAGIFVLGDRQRLRQALTGITLHAVRFSPHGGHVSIRCDARREGIAIEVVDSGEGIEPEQVERLFSTFETRDGGAPERGPQLGLPLAKALVEAMGGSVSVESRQGQGSTVTVLLATAEDPLTRIPDADLSGVGRDDGAAHTILYIEDNLANLDLVQRILAHRPATTLLRATLGEVGLQLAREQQPDLVLLDLHLPDMGGEETLARLRAEPETAAIPVVVMSSEQRERPTEPLRQLGIAGFMPKPIDVHAFLELVDGALAQPRVRSTEGEPA